MTTPTKITEVSYGKTVNLGNYESARFDLTAKVLEDQDWKQCLQDLITEVKGLTAAVKQQSKS